MKPTDQSHWIEYELGLKLKAVGASEKKHTVITSNFTCFSRYFIPNYKYLNLQSISVKLTKSHVTILQGG